MQEPKPHELAPLWLIPKVAMVAESADEPPWHVYVSPLLQSYAASRSGLPR